MAIALAERLKIPLISSEHMKSIQRDDPSYRRRILVVDDVVDSGKTYQKYHAGKFACIHEKKGHAGPPVHFAYQREVTDWIVYFWETSEVGSIEDSVVRQLQYMGEDVTREGLVETPARVIKSYKELYAGYQQSPAEVFKLFKEGACDEMVLLKDVEFYSTCEHHMLPFFGKAHIAYIPNGKVVGISKLARLLEVYSRRLQIQERIGQQVTSCLAQYLEPLGAACVLEAQHFCMTSRGVQKQNSVMVTSSLTGVFRDQPATRAEFYSLIRS